ADLAIRRHRSRLVLRSLDADREARAARRQINMMPHLLDRLARLLQNGLRPAIVLRLTGVPRQLRSLIEQGGSLLSRLPRRRRVLALRQQVEIVVSVGDALYHLRME